LSNSPGSRRSYRRLFQESKIILSSGKEFRVRRAMAGDVRVVTKLIHNAFEIWKREDLLLGPMYQSEAQTKEHLVRGGCVAEDPNGVIVGTFSLDEGSVTRTKDGQVSFLSGVDIGVAYVASGRYRALPQGKLLVFKKAAVCEGTGNSGLGAKLYALA
jgi:hypothetical protein